MIGLLFWSFVVVVLLLLLCVSDHGLVSSLNSEGYALLSFKQYISEDPDGSLSNWNMSGDTPCLWNGITCKEQRVVSVSIPKKKLFGFLGSSALGSLPDLRHVNLRNNKLYGSLSSDLFKDLRLQSLVLSGNSFSGFVPSQIGDLHYLQTLDLSQNFFNGSIPTTLLQCKRLKYLNLGHNNFTGSLPNGIGINLTSLEKLDLSFNKLGGPIPSDIGNLSSLQGTVDFSHNRFNGSIPASLGNLPEKVYIDLTFNNLNGPIPQNGALMNRGPTAFLGNPELCGPPLKTPCSPDTPGARASAHSPSSFPFLPHSSDDAHKNGKGKEGLSRGAIIIIIVCDVVGVCLVALLFSCCYSRIFACYETKDENEYALEKIGKLKRKDCFCFRNEESETPSENVDHYDLVLLDTQVGFDLDELLKASAFVLGKSGIGIVYKVVLEDGLILAVRRLGEGGSQRFKEFQTEVEAIGKLRHPNVVTLRAYYWSVEEKLLIYDYIPNGNLSTAIHGKAGSISFTPLPWSTRLRIMIGIARGLVYLHEFSPKKYVHGDLKPNNILLGENMEPHIADFGLGRLANIAGSYPTLQSDRTPEKQLPRQNSTGTAPSEAFTPGAISASLGSCYQAPEALKAAKPSQKWDVYSYGVILLEMITGRLPLVQVGTLEMDLVRWIQLCIEEKKPLSDVLDFYLAEDADCDEEMVAVLKVAMACVHASSEKRPAMRHVYDALERLRMNSA